MTVTISGTNGIDKVANGVVDATALAAGSVTQPKVGSGVAGSGPCFSAYQSSSQTLSTNTWTKIRFQSKEFDTANCFDSATNWRFTPTVAGYYQLNGGFAITSNNTTLYLQIYKNGSSFKYMSQSITQAGMYGSCLVYFNGTTDYVELYGYVSIGQALANDYTQTYFQGNLVRAA